MSALPAPEKAIHFFQTVIAWSTGHAPELPDPKKLAVERMAQALKKAGVTLEELKEAMQ